MKENRILVLGYFGFNNNQLDGQTVKTRSILELLKAKGSTFKVSYFDTQQFKIKKIYFFKMFEAISKADIIFYLPAHNNLKYIFPFIFLYCKLLKVPIHYVVVGGWLCEYLSTKPLHKLLLGNIEAIYPQTKDLCECLKSSYGYTNVFHLNNYRITSFVPKKKAVGDEIKLVFMARVQPEKGINTVFLLSERLKELGIKHVYIDVFGPISSAYEDEFRRKLGFAPSNIEYKGVLQPDVVHETLSNYDVMLFPTEYYTEGFPGSILDGYIAGLPVVATDWKYSSEFVEENMSGLIVEFKNPDKYINEVVELIKFPEAIQKMQHGALAKARQFQPEHAWKIIYNNLVSL